MKFVGINIKRNLPNIKSTFIDISEWVIPPKLFRLVYGLINIGRKQDDIKTTNAITSIIKESNIIKILGNGPSLESVNIPRTLIDNDVFVCNEFNQHHDFEYIVQHANLTYFYGDNKKSFEKINKEFVGDWDKMIEIFFEGRISYEYNTIINFDLIDIIKDKYPNSKVFGFSLSEIRSAIYKQFEIKGISIDEALLDKALNIRHTPNLMILAALSKGYNEVHLYGLDHSYVRDRFLGIYDQLHFYKEFDQTIIATGDMRNRDLSELFYDSHLTFELYKVQNELAKKMGVKIIDFTKNGCLDMFEKGII